MDFVTILKAILILLSGIGVFLFGCRTLSHNLEAVASGKLKKLFAKTSNSKLIGVGIGTVATAAIQSSAATTVMVIGFVNAGVMSLVQAATIIYGANIGTTITAQIVALGMFGESTITTTVIFASFAGIGTFINTFAKKETIKQIGRIVSGFGMLFVGLSLMSSSMSIFAESQVIRDFLALITNPLLLVLVGVLITALLQSSAVVTSIIITMLVGGLFTLDQGIFLTMGSNIGSCVVALLAGLSSNTNGKRTSIIHLTFNTAGVVLFLIIYLVMWLVSGQTLTFGSIFSELFKDAPQTQLAMFHTFFNVTTVLIMLPLTKLLVKFVEKIIPEKQEKITGPKFFYIDENMLKTPSFAVGQVKKEIINMSKIALSNYNASLDMITKLDFKNEEEFFANEEQLDFYEKSLTNFIVRLEECKIGVADIKYLANTFHTIIDLERIGDYSVNIVEYAKAMHKNNEHFSDSAIAEIGEMRDLINNLYNETLFTYEHFNEDTYQLAIKLEDDIDVFTEKMNDRHLERLEKGKCSVSVGTHYLNLASHSERIGDHLMNIVQGTKV